MAFAPHTRCSFGGRLTEAGQPNEIWNCNVNVTQPSGGPLDEGDIDPYMALLGVALSTWFTNPGSQIYGGAHLDYLKVNTVTAAGTQPNSNTHQVALTALGTNNSTTTMPFIMCFAFSWRTAIARGPGSHGRVYLPNSGWTRTVGGGMALNTLNNSDIATNAQEFLTCFLGGAPGIAAIPVIASRVNATNTAINGIAIGNVADVQRRRKNALTESYVNTGFPI